MGDNLYYVGHVITFQSTRELSEDEFVRIGRNAFPPPNAVGVELRPVFVTTLHGQGRFEHPMRPEEHLAALAEGAVVPDKTSAGIIVHALDELKIMSSLRSSERIKLAFRICVLMAKLVESELKKNKE